MSLILEPKTRDIGFPVKRLLPAAQRRAVGPFVFLDHMGPARFVPDTTEGDVRPHPHIGLATVTYLFSGAFMHRDSLGVVQRIDPGAVNWMTAGSGIVHSERVPEDVRTDGTPVQGIQMWVALPSANEEDAPSFRHYPAAVLPVSDVGGVRIVLLAGAMAGMESPVATPSPTIYAELQVAADRRCTLSPAYPELALYLVEGTIRFEDQVLEAPRLIVLDRDASVDFIATTASRLMLLGGAALEAPRHMWWNFVSSSAERIERAKRDWAEDRFGTVPGEHERIPLPEH